MTLSDLTSLCSRRGFIFPGSQIYGGLAGTWDYGPLGADLKRNLTNYWWDQFVRRRPEIYGLDSAILMHTDVWQASGHLAGFSDPVVIDQKTGHRHRADQLTDSAGLSLAGQSRDQINQLIAAGQLKSPDGNQLSQIEDFNMMFASRIGARDGAVVYLRPETAQGMFVNFANVVAACQPDLPFGLAQIGKAFRNEISPRDFVFRSREFEQMEIEYFCARTDKAGHWQKLIKLMTGFFDRLGLSDRISPEEVKAPDRAHYSHQTTDFMFEFPFGRQELAGLADRGDFDLTSHQQASGKNLRYLDKTSQEPVLIDCLEPTFGLDRLILAILTAAYRDDADNDRIYLALPDFLAPVKAAVSPLLANQPRLLAKARQVYDDLQARFGSVVWDSHGNIGKRYRRQDEIGTPNCFVIDHQTLTDGSLTCRRRDDLGQSRCHPDQIDLDYDYPDINGSGQ